MTNKNEKRADITKPSIDELLEHVDSKYTLAVLASDRARQLTTLNRQFQQGRLDAYDEAAVRSGLQEKNLLNEAFIEINEGKLELADRDTVERKRSERRTRIEEEKNVINDMVDVVANENIEMLKSIEMPSEEEVQEQMAEAEANAEAVAKAIKEAKAKAQEQKKE